MTVEASDVRPRGLDSAGLAAAATMASLCVGLVVLGAVVPHLGVLQLAAVVPFGVVAHRHGLRALIASLAAAAFVAALVIGLGGAIALALFAGLGGLVGELKRHGRGAGTACLLTVGLAPLAAGAFDLLLLAFSAYRRLVLANILSTTRGLASALDHLGPLGHAGHAIRQLGATLTAHWALAAALIVIIALPLALLGSWILIGEVLDRLQWVRTATHWSAVPGPDAAVPPAPLPVSLHGVCVDYGEIRALSNIDLRITGGQFIAVVGDNGSGKSTLARVLAGVPPSAGRVERAGSVALGQAGGTALIGQRPDAQVLGLLVRDDVVWGLPPDHEVDVEELLTAVGLAGMAMRETSALSGGQLQRLAIAAALARRPQLLVSDESTAMIDPAGRRELVGVLAELPRTRHVTVVHVTHHEDEVGRADRVLRLRAGRLITDGPPTHTAAASEPAAGPASRPLHVIQNDSPRPEAPVDGRLVLEELGHAYANGTVWEHRALEELTLRVGAGEGVLVVGENGSGKSTLAWIIAGLVRPSEGACLLDGQPTHRRRGAVGLAFQHARLQLQRPTVGADIADAAGWGGASAPVEDELEQRVRDALRAVRLDPALATRSVEALSGGQQRRVALAGLLAARPEVLVLDEPLAGLDEPSRRTLVELLLDLRSRRGLTLIVVSHDPESLAEVCPRLIRLAQGRLVEDTAALASPAPARSSDAA